MNPPSAPVGLLEPIDVSDNTLDVMEYWNYVPEQERTLDCPIYLQGLSEKDQRILSSWDSEFKQIPWDGEDGVKNIIQTNQIHTFRRSPSQLRLYRKYIYDMTNLHGDMISFILTERLRWSTEHQSALLQLPTPATSVVNSSASSICSFQMQQSPFENETNWKILRNDWPYGIDPRVVHLVVWTKFPLTEEPETGGLTVDIRALIEDFVQATFSLRIGADNVVWFKNSKALKSIQSIEHFHVMLFDPEPDWICELTGEKDLYRA